MNHNYQSSWMMYEGGQQQQKQKQNPRRCFGSPGQPIRTVHGEFVPGSVVVNQMWNTKKMKMDREMEDRMEITVWFREFSGLLVVLCTCFLICIVTVLCPGSFFQ